jgi:hypothetical protein
MQLDCTAYTTAAVTLTVTDLPDRVYTTKQFRSAPFTTEMDLGALPPGTYPAVLNSDGARTVQRFIRKQDKVWNITAYGEVEQKRLLKLIINHLCRK